jgi:hypothetical protein
VEKRDIDFMAWNEYVDNHFRELHSGISKLPPKLKFGNAALTYWAEKWSSLFGEWIYDELFGYVWRPADDRFAHAERPFFHADFIRVNGQLFLVPQQQWGWVPAHMGTWVWLKRGWTWIPGDWFHNGVVEFQNGSIFPTLSYYMRLYRGYTPWNSNGSQLQGPPDHESKRPALPRPVIAIVKRVEKIPASERHGIERAIPVLDVKKTPPVTAPGRPMPMANASGTRRPDPSLKTGSAIGQGGENGMPRDWNPDSRWAARSGYSIRYSSSGNAVVCPELKISSDNLRSVERTMLREGASPQGQSSDPAAGAANSGQPANTSSGSLEGAVTSKQGDKAGPETKDDGKGK